MVILTWIQQYLTYALCLVIALLLIFIGVQTVRLNLAKAAEKVAISEKKEIQGLFALQSEGIKQAGEATARMKKQAEAKNREATQARGLARERAEEIMRLKLSKDCVEVSKWGVLQGRLQGTW